MKKSAKLFLFTLISLSLFLSISNGIMAQAARDPIEIGVFNFYDGLTAENLRAFENSSGRHVYSALIYEALTVEDFVSFPKTLLNEDILYHEPYDSKTIPMTTWEPKMTLQSIHEGNYDQEITAYANAAIDWAHPLRIRFAHEMIQNDIPGDDGWWYSWQDQPEDYKAAFQHIVTIFKNQGADQVEFVWCPNHYPADFDTIKKYYPGEKYVDWLCMDGYNWTNQDNAPGYPDWQSFDQVFSPIYTVFQDNTAFFGEKPIMIGEFGSCEASDHDPGQSKAAWITDAFARIKSDDYARITAFYWFNADKSDIPDSFECNWRIDSSPASEIAFRNALTDPIFISHPSLDFLVFLPMTKK